MSLEAAGPALPVFPNALIQLQGTGFGWQEGIVKCRVRSSSALQLAVSAYDWDDDSIYAQAPSVEDLQLLMAEGLSSEIWPRVMSLPVSLEVISSDGYSKGFTTVCIYIGGPIVESVTGIDRTAPNGIRYSAVIDVRKPGPRDFWIDGFNFGDPDYLDFYFSVVPPPWAGVEVTSSVSGGSFYTRVDRPYDDRSFLSGNPICIISDAQQQELADFTQNSIRLNPFITSSGSGQVHFSLPQSLDLGLIPGEPVDFSGNMFLDAYIVAFRNFVPSRPYAIKVAAQFFGL